MDQAELLRRLMITFASELQEHLRALNRDLLALEQAPDESKRHELLISLLRTAHSLKGAARAVGVDDIAVVCHKLEETFTDLRDGKVVLSDAIFEEAYRAADVLQRASERIGVPRKTAPPSAAAAAPRPQTSQPPESPREGVVRLQSHKLDSLANGTADLLVARRRAEERTRELESLLDNATRFTADMRKRADTLPRAARPAFDEAVRGMTALARGLSSLQSSWSRDLRSIDQASRILESRIAEARMLPFSEVTEGLQRVVRDIAVAASKEVDLVLSGTDVALDRAILESLKDPLVHLVRNAVDHGIELPDERAAAGKSRRGRIDIAARLHGARVAITVSDDGRGIDLDAVRRKANERNLVVPDDRHELVRMLFLPGFSTAQSVTEVSGRGVGLDVVKSRAESVHGTLSIDFIEGHGTTFTIDVPITLTIAKGLIVASAGQQYALLSSGVERLLSFRGEELKTLEARSVLLFDEAPVAVTRLSDILGKPDDAPLPRGPLLAVMLRAADRRAAFIIDAALTEQEIAVTALGHRVSGLRLASGATLLPNGKVALVLNASELLDTALSMGREIAIDHEGQVRAARKRLIVADDSVTTRTLEKSILESAGYIVVTAADGEEAWRLLQERGADLVVSDVEMPRMDGYTLAHTIRSSARFREVPVVLVTARENDADKLRGMEAGASAYLLKSAFDQQLLLETLQQLL